MSSYRDTLVASSIRMLDWGAGPHEQLIFKVCEFLVKLCIANCSQTVTVLQIALPTDSL